MELLSQLEWIWLGKMSLRVQFTFSTLDLFLKNLQIQIKSFCLISIISSKLILVNLFDTFNIKTTTQQRCFHFFKGLDLNLLINILSISQIWKVMLMKFQEKRLAKCKNSKILFFFSNLRIFLWLKMIFMSFTLMKFKASHQRTTLNSRWLQMLSGFLQKNTELPQQYKLQFFLII